MFSIGCDFGLRKSGIVILDGSYEIVSQNLIQTDEHVKGAERLVLIEEGFNSILNDLDGQDMEVFVEGYAYGAKFQRESLAELGGVIRRNLFLRKQAFWVVPPTSVKMYVTGSGRATKNYMKKCTKEKWNESFKSDDVCDAYGLSRVGMNIMLCDRDLQDYPAAPNEQQVIQEIIENKGFYKNRSTAGRKKNARKRKTKSQQ